jgi:hypothetical protein
MDPGIAALVAAIFTGLGTIVASLAGAISSRNKANEDCHEKLKLARKEGEEAAFELHEIRMNKFKELDSGNKTDT